MNLIINLKLESGKPRLELDILPDINPIVLNIFISRNIHFDDLFSDLSIRNLIRKELDNLYEENAKHNFEVFDYSIEILNMILARREKLTDLVSEIRFDATPKMEEYMKKNPSIQSHPLSLNKIYSISNKDLESIGEYFKSLDNLKILIDGNQEKIGIREYENTINAINELVLKIKKYNLSPLEEVMYAYDLVRDRMYVPENEVEKYTKSRDLSSVLLGDKIVCVGFANILDKVLKNLDIKSDIIFLVDEKRNTGHARNVIYIKDDKYNVEAMYYLDPTWDCKKNVDSNDFLNSYTYFCRTKVELKNLSLKKGYNYYDQKFESLNEDMILKVEEKVKNGLISSISKDTISLINRVSNFIDGEYLIDPIILLDDFVNSDFIRNIIDFEKIINRLCYYKKIIFDCSFTSEQLLKLLMNVRKVEFYDNPEKYPYDIFAMEKVAVSNFVKDEESKELQRILDFIFDINPEDRKMTQNQFDTISEKEEYEKKIEQVKFAKVLRKVYEKKL